MSGVDGVSEPMTPATSGGTEMKPADTPLEIFIKEWLARWEDLRAAQIERAVRETVRVHAGSIDRGINVRCSGCDKTVGTWAAFADHIAAIVSERIAQ